MLVVNNTPVNAGYLKDVGMILGWEDPLEEGMATHSSILSRRIPWTVTDHRVAQSRIQLKQLRTMPQQP